MRTATDALRRQRRLRVIEVAILILGVADLVLNLGSLMVLMPVFVVALMAWALRVNARTVRLIQHTNRPRPDYAAIARMEREVYGKAFEHAGGERQRQLADNAAALNATVAAIGVSVAEINASMNDLAEHATIRRLAPCWHCGQVPTLASGVCQGCYRMLKGYGIQPAKVRPVRYATCAEGHPDPLWVEGRGQVCQKCDKRRDREHRSNLRWG